MPEVIRDGTGSGSLARVDMNHRIRTHAVIETDQHDANIRGDAYNINTGPITLTDAVDTPVMYLKNTEEVKCLQISAIAIGISASTSAVTTAAPLAIITVVRNPTAIDFSVNVDINCNRNFGSSNTLSGLAYKGATDDTMTDGIDHILLFQTAAGRLFAPVDELLPPGASIGIKINPATGNDDMQVYAAIICHLEEV